ncbi:MAG TPA: nucleotide exchange factor GrpE [Ardenticatenaceae bacterium]|jgi:molecular chaperone GrpE
MSFWDPYDPYGRNRRRTQQEMLRRRAEQEAARRAQQEAAARAQAERTAQPPAHIIARFEEELVQARRERDEWADRYDQMQKLLDEERLELAAQRELVDRELEDRREQLRAEAEAQRERIQRNAEQRAFDENRQTMLRMVEVADNLERALSSAGEENHALTEGVRLTYRNFVRALEQSGVEPVESVGQPFNPTLHEAVATRPGDAEPGTILEEVGRGYRYRNTLLRPARVIVAG